METILIGHSVTESGVGDAKKAVWTKLEAVFARPARFGGYTVTLGDQELVVKRDIVSRTDAEGVEVHKQIMRAYRAGEKEQLPNVLAASHKDDSGLSLWIKAEDRSVQRIVFRESRPEVAPLRVPLFAVAK